MPFDAEHLYNLLPSVYRVRDSEQGGVLKELVAVLAGEVAAVIEEDLAQLYGDQFIETCADWVVPYIGDLIGYRSLYGVVPRISSPRAEVANTIGFRRRRGTVSMLEQLARDVTDWDARVVEFFSLLATTQHVQHIRPANLALASVRRLSELERIGTPFDPFTRSLDVRRIASGRGRYNIPNIGIFLWRLGARSVTDVPLPPPAGDQLRYRFDPLGVDRPLFSNPLTEGEIDQLAGRPNVPMPFTHLELRDNLSTYWGTSLGLSVDDPLAVPPNTPRRALAAGAVNVCDLADDPAVPGGWAHTPGAGEPIAVDPVLGRIAFPAGPPPTGVRASYHTAFSADIAGGEYDRASSFDAVLAQDPLTPKVTVPGDHAAIAGAVAALMGTSGIVEIVDNDRYDLANLTLAAGQRVEIRGANRKRPLLQLQATVSLGGGPGSELILNGLLIARHGLRVTGELDRLTIRHCTLVPGLSLTSTGVPEHLDEPSIRIEPAEANLSFTLEIEQSVTGPLRFPEIVKKLTPSELPGLRCDLIIRESIIDAGGRAPRALRTPALVSGVLAPFPVALPSLAQLRLTIGADGPHLIEIAPPVDLADAAVRLQTAIRSAAPGPAFDGAQVIAIENRLIVIGGIPDRVVLEPHGVNTAASLLLLDPDNARRAEGLLSAPLASSGTLGAASPALVLTIDATSHDLAGLPKTFPDLATLAVTLQTLVRAGTESEFAGAMIGVIGDRVLIVPGAGNAAPMFGGGANDRTSVRELGLSTAAAIGAGPDGEATGPVATIDRATIIGPVYVAELSNASESIFLGQVIATQRQAGCARFCYLPPGSRTPRRYQCQPVSGATSREIQPAFTSLRFGDPAYAQLGLNCPVEITLGAEDDVEMGVFHDLFQSRRETNLRVRLEEYLRLGLEAGIIFAS